MLPMITAQRDRYKRKNAELESNLQKSDRTIQSLRSEVASLQKDNLNLYEKTRYVSTYSRGHPAASGTAYGSGPTHTSIAIDDGGSGGGGGASLDQRYRPAYEATLNPFTAFRSRESSRAFRRMGLPERAVFHVTKMVLATRTSRNLFALYCVALHLLVLAMLYNMGSCSSDVLLSAGAVGTGGGGAVGRGAAAGPRAGGGSANVEWHKEGFQEGG